MPDTPEENAFRRVVEIFGGITPLSQWLKVPADSLRKWISGEELPPRAIYLQVKDIIGGPDRKLTPSKSQSSSTDSIPSGVGLGMRVLIADGERDTLMTLGILLRSEGFDVRLIQGGAEVAYAVREFCPHAVLLGLDMPDRNGYEVATELRQDYGHARPVLIAVMAHSSDSDKRAAEICGFHHHLSKPYDPEVLLNLLVSLKH